MKKKICVCGSFGFGTVSLNGQTIKTEIVTNYYKDKYGDGEILTLDTRGILNFSLLPIKLLISFLRCENIIILPAHNSLRLIAPLCRLFQLFTSKKTHYLVIGGWLPHYLNKHRLVFWGIKSFLGIYPETETMKKSLESLGLNNVVVLPNCKQLEIIDEHNKDMQYPPLRLCTFSRINRKKGINDAATVIDRINKEYGKIVVQLDLYGRVDAGEQEWFNNFYSNLPAGVCFKGAVEYDKSVSTLKNYHALLFPTKYYTEGIPGTIIDAYAAGLPVIASNWESCADIVSHQKTGFVYEFDDIDALKSTIIAILNEPDMLLRMRKRCIETAYNYLPENVLPIIKLK